MRGAADVPRFARHDYHGRGMRHGVPVIELGIALLLGVFLAGGTWVVTSVPWQTQLWTGIGLIAFGLAVSIPTGFWYHVKLWRALGPRGVMARRWWLSPVREHVHLTDAERPGVMLWFRIGAAFFGVALLGCALVLAGGLQAR